MAEVDWRYLRGAIIIVMLCISVSAGLIGGSVHFWSLMDRQERKQRSAFLDIRNKYQSIDEEERLIEKYLPRYRELEEAGLIGRERRLNWIESLREVSRSMKLPEVRYSIRSQGKHKPSFAVPQGQYQIYASVMELNLGMLHEGDFPRLLLDLSSSANGMHSVSRCTFSRTGAVLSRDPTTANIAARCELEWYTVRQPEGRS